jgi:23S rRNA (uracil1939-C5)-methyltransferase
VRAQVTKVKKSYGEARLVERLVDGPGRVDAPCPHFGVCGGCKWQDLDYRRQLEWKTRQVGDALQRIGHLDGYELAPIVGADHVFAYRNKLELSFTPTPAGPALGFHRAGRWDQVLPIDVCLLTGEPGNAARRVVEGWARAQGLEAFHPRIAEGTLRHLVMRTSDRTGDVLLTLVTSREALPGEEALVAALEAEVPGFCGLLHATNDGVADSTAGLPSRLVSGRPYLEELLLGLRLRVSSGAFLQTNTSMCERLYEIAIAEAGLTGTETVWDLYSGIGSIALALAGSAREVIGVEVVDEAVERARENAVGNGVGNVRFEVGDVARAIEPLVAQGLPSPDVVVIDPPRAGLTPRAIRGVLELAPDRIVYVSCNPTTLAGNAAELAEGGYRLVRVRPVDMFPHTAHVECVARFERGDVDRADAAA